MEIGVNINGDRSLEMIEKGAVAAEKSGFSSIWVGEKPKFFHPFTVIAAIAHSTKKVKLGSGIISPLLNRCDFIKGGFNVLRESYGNRFVVGLAPGDRMGLRDVGVQVRRVKEKLVNCLLELKQQGFEVYVGVSDPALASLGGKIADGLLINYVKPEYVEWAISKTGKKVLKAAYGPSLLFPDNRRAELLLIGAAIVAAGSSLSFQREFGLVERVEELKMIISRRAYGELHRHRDFLLENFTISGKLKEIKERVVELEGLGVSQVIFGAPMSHNISSIAELGRGLSGL